MVLFIKLLFLLWFINFAPPFSAQVFEQKWSRPIDGGTTFFLDGQPVFGSNKTFRGLSAGIFTGMLAGVIFGFPWWLGLGAGTLSMAGDLFSSFLKRRLYLFSGDVVPVLDQTPEGVFPFLLLGPYFSLSLGYIFACLIVFGFGAFCGSVFFQRTLMTKPFDSYPRPVCPKTRIRELLSCQITSRPFHHILNFEDAVYYHLFMKTAFQMAGIYERGKQNALLIDTKEVLLEFPDLPPSFDGYRILFLTDLHLDGLDGLTDKLLGIVREIPSDLCILGGDFRMETHGPFAEALSHLRHLIPRVRTADGIYAVLGNHDCLEIVEPLQREGITFLVNESCVIERGGEKVWLVGVDDAHYFKCHDLDRAFCQVPAGGFSIFVSHSNEIYREAAEYGPNLFLCGHTHGGQIRLPALGPLFTHSSAPRSMYVGQWNYRGMPGYTSEGVGVSGVPVRFNSRGEVTVITLGRK